MSVSSFVQATPSYGPGYAAASSSGSNFDMYTTDAYDTYDMGQFVYKDTYEVDGVMTTATQTEYYDDYYPADDDYNPLEILNDDFADASKYYSATDVTMYTSAGRVYINFPETYLSSETSDDYNTDYGNFFETAWPSDTMETTAAATSYSSSGSLDSAMNFKENDSATANSSQTGSSESSSASGSGVSHLSKSAVAIAALVAISFGLSIV